MWPSRPGGGTIMKWSVAEGLGVSLASIALAGTLALVPAQAASERALFISVGSVARAPVGWSEFCAEYASECETTASVARGAVLTNQAWSELLRINEWV